MSFILIGFGVGSRGEEVPLVVSLRGLPHFWDETRLDPDSFIVITLHERFKGKTGFWWHCLPIFDLNQSGTPFRKWVGLLLHWRVTIQGRNADWLFQKGRSRARLRDYDVMFIHYITEIHSLYPSLFSVGTLLDLFST